MFGVASMLCRLGVRLNSTSALASRLIADFMAILAYVNFEKDGYLSSYASDPILTLGAMKVWYGHDDVLSKYILPQLKKLILDEALDTGEVGEMVARIVLLLAMDKCVMGEKTIHQCDITGKFILVQDFLKELGVGKMPILKKKMAKPDQETTTAFNDWCSQWDGWQMRFTHFVQLKFLPNEDTLWYLLGRPAAEMFPRNQKGGDLLIPIFRKEKVIMGSKAEWKTEASMILIQVKNRHPSDKLQTPIVNPLSKNPFRDVIHMNVQEENSSKYRFIYAKKLNDSDEANTASSELGFTLCYRSLRREAYPFLDEEVASRLTSLAESAWDPMALVVGDLRHRRDVEYEYWTTGRAVLSNAVTDEGLKRIASQGLVDAPGYCNHAPASCVGGRNEEEECGKQHPVSTNKREQEGQGSDLRKHQRV